MSEATLRRSCPDSKTVINSAVLKGGVESELRQGLAQGRCGSPGAAWKFAQGYRHMQLEVEELTSGVLCRRRHAAVNGPAAADRGLLFPTPAVPGAEQ